MLCREWTLVKHQGREIIAQPLKCRSWTCDHCAPERKRQVQALARSGQPNRFITLTVNPEWGRGPEDRAAHLANAWRLIVKRAKRHYGYDRIEYFAIFEAQKSGEPHLHILARCEWIDQKWLSDQMLDLMNAPVVDIRKIWSTDHAAFYVSKYVGKDPQRFGSCKRYWTTQGYDLSTWGEDLEDEPFPPSWSIDFKDLWSYVSQSKALGFTATWDGDRVYLRYPRPPPESPFHIPF